MNVLNRCFGLAVAWKCRMIPYVDHNKKKNVRDEDRTGIRMYPVQGGCEFFVGDVDYIFSFCIFLLPIPAQV